MEAFLGWAMLVPYSQCCKAIVTEATWSELEHLLQERGWPRQGLGRHVGRLYGMLVGAVRHRGTLVFFGESEWTSVAGLVMVGRP